MIKLEGADRYLKELYLSIVEKELNKHKCSRCGRDNAKYDTKYNNYFCEKCLKELQNETN